MGDSPSWTPISEVVPTASPTADTSAQGYNAPPSDDGNNNNKRWQPRQCVAFLGKLSSSILITASVSGGVFLHTSFEKTVEGGVALIKLSHNG